MVFLQQKFLDNSLGDWLIALLVAAALVLVIGLLRTLVVRRLAALAQRTSTSVDDLLVAVARRTHLPLLALPAFWLGGRSLALPDRLGLVLTGAASLALVLQLGLWISGAIDFWIARSRARAVEQNTGAATSLAALNFIGKTVLWALLLLFALDNLGVNVTAMVAGLGVGGVAVALAVQNILGDLFASLSIVIDKPFVVGDFIIVESYMGTVQYVGLKTTRLLSLDGEQIVFSNGDLLKARLRNYKQMQERRVVFKFYILYETPADKLEKVAPMIRAIIQNEKLVRLDRAHFASFGEWAYVFEVVYWMLTPDYNTFMDTQQRINLEFVRQLDAAGIGFAYPARKLHVAGPLTVHTRSEEPPAPSA